MTRRATHRPTTLRYRARDLAHRHALTIATYATLALIPPLTVWALNVGP